MEPGHANQTSQYCPSHTQNNPTGTNSAGCFDFGVAANGKEPCQDMWLTKIAKTPGQAGNNDQERGTGEPAAGKGQVVETCFYVCFINEADDLSWSTKLHGRNDRHGHQRCQHEEPLGNIGE